MDYTLQQRRHRKSDMGVEVWLVAIWESGGAVPVLTVTNNPGGDIEYGGQTYIRYNLSVEPPQAESEGLPVGALTISNVLRALQSSMAASDYYRGGKCVIVSYNTALPAADYSDDTHELTIVSHESQEQDVKFTLSAPSELTDQVPEDVYRPYACRHRFRLSEGVYSARCGYTKFAVTGVTLPSGAPVIVTVTAHIFATGDTVELSSMSGIGITPDLSGTYTITDTGANTFTLDGTDGDDYAGAYTSGGYAGHSVCGKLRSHCRARGRAASFGGFPSLRNDGLRIAG